VTMGCCGPTAHPITPPTCSQCAGTSPTGHCDPTTSLCADGPLAERGVHDSARLGRRNARSTRRTPVHSSTP
jgi:hypothetical protein